MENSTSCGCSGSSFLIALFIISGLVTLILWIVILVGKHKHRKETLKYYSKYSYHSGTHYELMNRSNYLHSLLMLNMYFWAMIPIFGIFKIINCYSNYMHSSDVDRFLDRYSALGLKPFFKF